MEHIYSSGKSNGINGSPSLAMKWGYNFHNAATTKFLERLRGWFRLPNLSRMQSLTNFAANLPGERFQSACEDQVNRSGRILACSSKIRFIQLFIFGIGTLNKFNRKRVFTLKQRNN